MQLYIHFGIYKAGSSYLQYIAANSRNYLEQQQIYFPSSKEDHKMKEGFISKGNADGLEKVLIQKNEERCTKILQIWKEEAMRKNCNKVLVSAEALVHQLAIDDSIETLINSSKKADFTTINVMGFFRDLVDHAISTYKHRAKSGNIPDYIHWIADVYETPKLLENLTKSRNKYNMVDWTFRKFQKDSDFLKTAFFYDWLQIHEPEFKGSPIVNESITISEVFLMQSIKKNYALVTDYFVDALKAIPKKEKGIDKVLEEEICSVFYNSLSKKNRGIEQLNNFLPQKEKLYLGNFNQQMKDLEFLNHISLSEKQIQIFIETMHFFGTSKGKMVLLRRKLVQLLPKKMMKGFLIFNDN